MPFETRTMNKNVDAIAPDGSEIRFVAERTGGSVVHCTLPPGTSSKAIRHRTVEEIWLFLEGQGEVWRALDDQSECVSVGPNSVITIPLGAHFQFRNTGETPLRFVITTMPPWPGEEEAIEVADYWPTG